ncbi:MAG TPA: CoA transferase [Acidisphaera sp.]|nr:CoA transferase [Acidisphaera sp.]
MHTEATRTDIFLHAIWNALGGGEKPAVTFVGEGELPSAFAVSDLAAGATGAAALAVAELIGVATGHTPSVSVDRRLASLWFGTSIRPEGWARPSLWDAIAGNYAASDGWIRLHTNAPHHQAAALAVLGVDADKDAVRAAVACWKADDLEAAIVGNGGCAARMRTQAEWAEHPQGKAVAAEPLAWWETNGAAAAPDDLARDPARPLAGVRVLDLTRVLAGPAATRFLAGFGADVLRIDPPTWDEPAIVPEMTLGKRCARLDLRAPENRDHLLGLLAEADVVVHGYRSDALERLGLGAEARRLARPGIVDVSLDAYGWTGPWAARRGFDSLVQMSAGIAEEGMRRYGTDRPTPLPVQAIDHATGCIMAAAAVRGLTQRLRSGVGMRARVSLARTAALLTGVDAPGETHAFPALQPSDFDDRIEATPWGPARRLRPAVAIENVPMRWERAANALGSSPARW